MRPTTDIERSNPRFHWEQFQGNLELVAEMRRLIDEKQVAARQLALAARSRQMTSCRFRGGAVGELEQNATACAITLSPGHLERIEALTPREPVE